ncbi:MAG: toxin [Gammaproteobacteria bacterium]|nr:toxin [Gammaproteobacteria bacterium]MCW5584017.1 toxin [Gammaproteobacteria bacterium]
MPHYEFSADKNQQLIKERHISFDDIIAALGNDKLLDTISHHNRTKYPNQEIYIIEITGYVFLVPFVKKDKNTVFLKTIIPSRKLTKKYLGKRGA